MVIRLFLRYNGTAFHGWQIQNESGQIRKDLPTVQGVLLNALKTLLQNDGLVLTGCSRTDAGVHALMYCASFEVESTPVPPEKISQAIKHLLPSSITVYKSETVPEGFNARFDTKSKTYKYVFYQSAFSDPLLENFAWFVKGDSPLDLGKMQEATKYFLGTHDFSAFCAAGDEKLSHERTLSSLSVLSEPMDSCIPGTKYTLEITGDGFLYNMVRIITGTIMYVGCGKIQPSDIAGIIESKDRRLAGITAPPEGLYLKEVIY